ncbi:hypothetical protein R6Q59_034447 [Mikania micrantha]|uniref:Uncharacterized protein n=1 Tax=Mikania micrantha TaxID=192012 RepID=A0A5N6NJZ6_9ASTR|nr:hypothetical protein E3N88_20630 [Mikania micrantha]
MEAQSSSKASNPVSKKPSKRFLYDKRYGYVYDDWRDPAEVALAYGRGMFCIVPLGKALFTTVSESVNLVASQTIKILEQPDQLSSQSLQKVNNLSNQLHQVMFSVKNMQSNALKFNKISYQRP